jgi:hypothetical protein
MFSIITYFYNLFFDNSINEKEEYLLSKNLITEDDIKHLYKFSNNSILAHYNNLIELDNTINDYKRVNELLQLIFIVKKILIEEELLENNLITKDEIKKINLLLDNKKLNIYNIIDYYNNINNGNYYILYEDSIV